MFPLGSALVQDPKFQDRVVAETRALLSTIPLPLPRTMGSLHRCCLRDNRWVNVQRIEGSGGLAI